MFLLISAVVYFLKVFSTFFFLSNYQNFPADKITFQVDCLVYEKSGQSRIAKSFDRISKNEKFQLVLVSDNDVNLLVLNKSTSDCQKLEKIFIVSNKTYYLPSKNEYYSFDYKSKREELFIVVFNKLVKELEPLLNPTTDCTFMSEKLNEYYIKRYYVEKNSVPPLIQISGNIRDMSLSEKLSGYDIIIKKYSFDVQ